LVNYARESEKLLSFSSIAVANTDTILYERFISYWIGERGEIFFQAFKQMVKMFLSLIFCPIDETRAQIVNTICIIFTALCVKGFIMVSRDTKQYALKL